VTGAEERGQGGDQRRGRSARRSSWIAPAGAGHPPWNETASRAAQPRRGTPSDSRRAHPGCGDDGLNLLPRSTRDSSAGSAGFSRWATGKLVGLGSYSGPTSKLRPALLSDISREVRAIRTGAYHGTYFPNRPRPGDGWGGCLPWAGRGGSVPAAHVPEGIRPRPLLPAGKCGKEDRSSASSPATLNARSRARDLPTPSCGGTGSGVTGFSAWLQWGKPWHAPTGWLAGGHGAGGSPSQLHPRWVASAYGRIRPRRAGPAVPRVIGGTLWGGGRSAMKQPDQAVTAGFIGGVSSFAGAVWLLRPGLVLTPTRRPNRLHRSAVTSNKKFLKQNPENSGASSRPILFHGRSRRLQVHRLAHPGRGDGASSAGISLR